MAGSGKRLSADLAGVAQAALARHAFPGTRLTAALSGGLDSVVLLDVLTAVAPALGLRLDALHVHHGLSRDADGWAAHAERTAAGYGVACAVVRVDCAPYRALGVEGAARAARYEAFARHATDLVALAHHLDDQAETLLVQLVRGAGTAGLAGMARWRRLERGPLVVRPLLGARRADLLAHARARGLAWVEDESNADPARTRSFIRARVMPALASLRPGVVAAIARSAAHAADAAELADALARIDAAACAAAERLDVARLLALPPARARNVLRFRVAALAGSPVEGAALDELLRQLASRRPGATVEVALGPAVVRRYAGEVWIERADPTPVPAGFSAEWTGETCWDLPALGGRLRFEPAHGEGLREAALRDGVEIRLRRGGERLRPRASGPRRALKDLLQEARVPPWRRSALPLVYCGGELAWVPHAGSDARFAAAPGERGRRLVWEAPR